MAKALRERVGRQYTGTQRTRKAVHGECTVELAKWTFPIISLCREPYEAKVSRTGLTGGMGRGTGRQRALVLAGKAVDTRVKRRERTPHGEGPELSETWDANVIDCMSGRSVPVNVDEMQKKLSQKATKEPEHHFENLYGLRCHEVWLRVAAHTVLQNKGSGTAGIDGMTKSHFLGDPAGYIRTLL